MKPQYRINHKIFNLVADISHAVGCLEVQIKRDSNAKKDGRIKSIHSSLALENGILSLEQIATIVDIVATDDMPKEISEVKNIYDSYDEILALDPYDKVDLLYANSLLTMGIEEESGMFRSNSYSVVEDSGETVNIGAKPQFIESLVEELLTWGEEEGIHDVITSCVMHYELIHIHPFSSSNGILARLWQEIILAKWNPIFELICVEPVLFRDEEEYYDLIKQANIEKDCTYFIEFVLEAILTTLREYNYEDNLDELNAEEKAVYQVICEHLSSNKYITTSEANLLTGKAKSTLRRYFSKYIKYELLDSVGENKNKRYFK